MHDTATLGQQWKQPQHYQQRDNSSPPICNTRHRSSLSAIVTWRWRTIPAVEERNVACGIWRQRLMTRTCRFQARGVGEYFGFKLRWIYTGINLKFDCLAIWIDGYGCMRGLKNIQFDHLRNYDILFISNNSEFDLDLKSTCLFRKFETLIFQKILKILWTCVQQPTWGQLKHDLMKTYCENGLFGIEASGTEHTAGHGISRLLLMLLVFCSNSIRHLQYCKRRFKSGLKHVFVLRVCCDATYKTFPDIWRLVLSTLWSHAVPAILAENPKISLMNIFCVYMLFTSLEL